jgi:hypothetical protein
VYLKSTTRRNGKHVPNKYSSKDIDYIVAYCPELNKLYSIPIKEFEGQNVVNLRITPTKNGHTSTINMASKYEMKQTEAVYEYEEENIIEELENTK